MRMVSWVVAVPRVQSAVWPMSMYENGVEAPEQRPVVSNRDLIAEGQQFRSPIALDVWIAYLRQADIYFGAGS